MLQYALAFYTHIILFCWHGFYHVSMSHSQSLRQFSQISNLLARIVSSDSTRRGLLIMKESSNILITKKNLLNFLSSNAISSSSGLESSSSITLVHTSLLVPLPLVLLNVMLFPFSTMFWFYLGRRWWSSKTFKPLPTHSWWVLLVYSLIWSLYL